MKYHSLLTAFAVILLVPGMLPAQGNDLDMDINEIDITQFPAVTLRMKIRKPLNSNLDINAGRVQLSENGILQNVEYFECPDDSAVRLSLAILLDRSGSMTRDRRNRYDPDSTKIRAAKAAIGTFLDLLGPRDEAAIFSFTTGSIIPNHIFRVEHDFNSDFASLKASLVPIYAEGGTRLWEAIIDGVNRLRVRPGRKALIVVTDGRNQFGDNFRATAIQNAVNERIPVYPIGLGDDIDVGELSSLAAATGGRFYPAPDADDLKEIFNQLGSELITDDCILRYTSSNPCLDGSRRDLLMTLNGPGFFGEEDTSYTVEQKLNPVTVIVEQGVRAIALDTAVVPMTVLEQFSVLQPLTYTMTIDYNAALMRFLDVSTDGTMSEGYVIDVMEDIPGRLRIALRDFLPALPTGHLFELLFEILPRISDSAAVLSVSDVSVTGLCPFAITTRDGEIDILACEERYTIGSQATFVAGNGDEVAIPIRIIPPPAPGRSLQLRFHVPKTDPALEFLGVGVEGTLAESANLLVQDLEDRIECLFVGDAMAPGDTVCMLRFLVRSSQLTEVHTLPLSLLEMMTGCNLDVETQSPLIIVDGICRPLLRRNGPLPALSNYPNPFPEATTLRFSLPEDGPVQLLLLDAGGRMIRILLEAQLTAGSYEHRFKAGDMPAGEYIAVMRIAKETVVRRMLLLR
ncbi:MAG: VWA domain-containing protein [Bacteroidetes bacterium]|nr:VWA domain-containing protein [Bacteroidota bacterium]